MPFLFSKSKGRYELRISCRMNHLSLETDSSSLEVCHVKPNHSLSPHALNNRYNRFTCRGSIMLIKRIFRYMWSSYVPHVYSTICQQSTGSNFILKSRSPLNARHWCHGSNRIERSSAVCCHIPHFDRLVSASTCNQLSIWMPIHCQARSIMRTYFAIVQCFRISHVPFLRKTSISLVSLLESITCLYCSRLKCCCKFVYTDWIELYISHWLWLAFKSISGSVFGISKILQQAGLLNYHSWLDMHE